jgi:glycolate oxidase
MTESQVRATPTRPVPFFPAGLAVERWSTDPAVVADRRVDRSGFVPSGWPVGVASAESVADVQIVLRAANAAGVPVVVRGAGTGLSGGAAGTDGCVILDVSGLDRIREISVVDAVAVVEPGVITAKLDRAAHRVGLRYAPDPASVEISTIGGNIATNAGGLRCAKYGVTADSVLGLDVVLADGELISTGGRTVKGVAGLDLTRLFVGSEGVLGVIVGATLRLRPIPVATATLAAYFDSVAAAVAVVGEIAAAGIVPAVAELLDGPTLTAIDTANGAVSHRARGEAFLLIQTDGAGAHAEASQIQALLHAGGAGHVTLTSDPEQAAGLVATRRAALPALERLGRVLIEDIAVPRSRLAEAITGIAAITESTGVLIYTMAHAADGNLHPIIVIPHPTNPDIAQTTDTAQGSSGSTQTSSAPDIPDHVWDAADQIFHLALNLGGTLTGEHGIGILKQRWLGHELGPRNHRLQQQLRQLFDPNAILNPGKAI